MLSNVFYIVMRSVIVLSAIYAQCHILYYNALCHIVYLYAQCHILYFYAECHYAECRYDQCHGAINYHFKLEYLRPKRIHDLVKNLPMNLGEYIIYQGKLALSRELMQLSGLAR